MLSHQTKAHISYVILLLIGLLSSCSPSGPRTIDNPWINFANTSTIDINKVELTDSATVLTVKATFIPHNWIKIASVTHLVADGKDYAMTKAEGIEPDKEFWMPDSGKAEFRLFFEPLPFSTKTFDFIEGDEEGAFRLLDIDITGNKIAKYPEGIPERLKEKVKDVEIPTPAFEMGKTTVNFHLCPYRPGLGSDFNVYVNTMTGEQQEHALNFDEKGNASLSLDQYGTAKAFVVDSKGNTYSHLSLYPGENIDCYLDARISGANAMANNRGVPTGIHQRNLHTGKYSDYDRAVAEAARLSGYRLQIYSGEFADYHMTGDEYKKMVKDRYKALSDSINNTDLPQEKKKYCMFQLQNDVLKAIVDHRSILERNFRRVKDDWSSPVPYDSIPGHLSENDFKEVTGWFDISNPNLLMVDDAIGYINWNKYGVPGDLSKSINMFSQMALKARKQNLSEADLDSLRTLSNPFFAIACDSLAKRTAREYLELQKNAHVMPTPNVADDKVFEAIISPYKGKVIMVDLWNTWCGPCRAAIKSNEPLKTGELSNDDIVWIYIADESSDPVKYLEMIPDIKGIHYKVNAEQIKAIREHFKVDGIPYYILVDREGKAEGRPDLRDHSRYIEAVKSKL